MIEENTLELIEQATKMRKRIDELQLALESSYETPKNEKELETSLEYLTIEYKNLLEKIKHMHNPNADAFFEAFYKGEKSRDEAIKKMNILLELGAQKSHLRLLISLLEKLSKLKEKQTSLHPILWITRGFRSEDIKLQVNVINYEISKIHKVKFDSITPDIEQNAISVFISKAKNELAKLN